MKIDFFARREHFIDHLAPIWNALPTHNKGTFYVYHELYDYAFQALSLQNGHGNLVGLIRPNNPHSMRVDVPGINPIVTCAYGDYLCAKRTNPNRVFIMAEHGVGLTPSGVRNGGYAGGTGERGEVDLFLAPNSYIANRTQNVYDTPQFIIGTPKLDPYANRWYNESFIMPKFPTLCISFHWDGSYVSPEASNAFSVFGHEDVLQRIKDKYRLIGHCHPKARNFVVPLYDKLGIPFVENFRDVMEIADIYINDCSSTMYEFLVTGKPVIIMDSPTFRRNIHYGIRFWDYSDIGKHVRSFERLDEAVQELINDPSTYSKQIQKTVTDLYPHLGYSTEMAVSSIIKFLEEEETMNGKLLRTPDYEQLKNLLSGANNGTKGISNIEVQHLSWLGFNIPPNTYAVEIGSHRGKSACCIASGIVQAGKDNKVNCIDLWDSTEATFEHYHSTETWEIFQNQVITMGYEKRIIPNKMSSEMAGKAYANSLEKGDTKGIGLLFIDANHWKPHVENDFQIWAKHVVSGGYIAFHDYGTRFPAVDEVVNDHIISSGEWEDFAVVGRIFSARKK